MERRRIVNRQITMFHDSMTLVSTPVKATPEKQAELTRALADLLLKASQTLDAEERR